MAFPFPLTCVLPTGDKLRPVKAFAEPSGEVSVYAWDATAGNGAEVVTGPVEQTGRQEWTVTGIDGLYVLSPGGGCGCSHPLKRWQATPKPVTLHAGVS